MIELFVFSALVIVAGIIGIGTKIPKWILLRMLGRSLAVDLGITVLTYVMHMGTFSGVMAAALAGALCSAMTSLAKKRYGYIRDGLYYRGRCELDPDTLRPPPTAFGRWAGQL